MTTQIVKRIDKGFPLTYTELDDNFENLRTTADSAFETASTLSAVLSSSKVTISSLDLNQLIDATTAIAPCTVKYVVQLNHNNNIHVEEILISYDGTNTYMSEYGVILSNSSLATFLEGYSNGKLNLYITPIAQPIKVSLVKQIIT